MNNVKLIKNYFYTIIFYESVHRIKNTLENMLEVLRNRKVCLARELSKLYEEYLEKKMQEVEPEEIKEKKEKKEDKSIILNNPVNTVLR